MRDDFNLIAFMSGLPTGIIVAGIIFYFVWRKGKKERRYDERYKRIRERAKSFAFGITMLVIIIAWAIVMIFEGATLAFFLITGIYVIAMVSYIIGCTIFEKKS